MLLQRESPAPIVGQGAAPRVTPFHPPAQHRAGPQSQLITPRGYRGILPTSSPATPHTPLLPKITRSWLALRASLPESGPLRQKPQGLCIQPRTGLGAEVVQLQPPPLSQPRAGCSLEEEKAIAPAATPEQDEVRGWGGEAQTNTQPFPHQGKMSS